MSPDIRPGALVTVVPPRELLRQGRRHVHFGSGLDLDGAVGIVDRIDRRYGEHRYVVVFSTVPKPMFGEPWVDCFRASELVPVDE